MNKEEMDFVVVDDAESKLLNQAAILHLKYLSYRSFITTFGSAFIVEIYKDIVANKLGFFVFSTREGEIRGFVLGCIDSSVLFKLITRKFGKYFKIILPQLLRSPKLFIKLFETLFYIRKEDTDVKAELIIIITESDIRSKGLGSHLVEILNEEFLKRGIREYKVTTHDEMKGSNNFYVKNGMTLANSFLMYGVRWNMYLKSLRV